MEDQSFGKHEHIRKKNDYTRIYRQGIRGYSEHFTWIIHGSPAGIRRLGITAGKKVGTAVRRNRVKRLLREFFRLNKSRLPEGQDIVIMVRHRMPFLTYKDVMGELEGLFVKESDG
ncbi:MAG: ribonuclease P protein component [Syntrophales bacterium]|nr:ribonuclease P protein component [Syntrophales bacterium]